MRFRTQKYGLVARKRKKATVWHYYHYQSGERSALQSTGIGFTRERDRARTRREAAEYCEQLLESGKLGQINQSRSITLQQFIDRTNFWDWFRSDYIRGILARSESNRAAITQTYVDTAAQITRDHILPEHGDRRLDKISPASLEQLLFTWSKNAAFKTANNRRSVYSVILGEATRLGYITVNPWKAIPPLKPEKRPRGALTVTEVSKLLQRPDNLSGTQLRYYLGCKIAFLTGLRMGEIRGLQTDDVIDYEHNGIRLSYLNIDKQHNQKLNKLTPTKDKDTRQIPIAAYLREELDPFITQPGRFLLSIHKEQARPISSNKMRDYLYAMMDAAGITEQQRTERRITFHSARRFFNTLLRQAGAADAIIQRFTGHDSDAMTEHYTDYLPQDMQVISAAQSQLYESGGK